KLHDGSDVAVLSVGPLGNDVADIIKEHEASDAAVKVSIAHYDMRFVKPLDEAILHEVGKKFKRIVTVEDGARNGGFGSAVLEWMSDNGYMPSIKRLGLPDQFIEHGTVPELREIAGIDKESIRKSVINT
ncbi:MAG: 1-deoxy-D-xylulose-5-phosphate synthase, partial [Prevotella sp.]|nr:1-deoxy-D-xylulose-5-phosphate synthase [Prevotella sp.]